MSSVLQYRACVCIVYYRALLTEYGTLLQGYTAHLTGCRVATISRLLQIIGLFCRIWSLL